MPWSKETTDSHKSSNPKPKTTKPISATNPDTMLDSVDACWPSFPSSSYQYTNSELSFHRTSSQQAVALRFSGERHSPQSFVGRRAQSNTVRLAPGRRRKLPENPAFLSCPELFCPNPSTVVNIDHLYGRRAITPPCSFTDFLERRRKCCLWGRC